MLKKKPDNNAFRNELKRLQCRLTEKDFCNIEKVQHVRRLIQGMISESSPSGCPDPDALAYVASLLREEKFREQRESCGHSPLSDNIQTLIDSVKQLKVQAEKTHPEEKYATSWHSRQWESGLITQLFSILAFIPFFILLTGLLFVDISFSVKTIILIFYPAASVIFAIIFKNHPLLITSTVLLALSVLLIAMYSVLQETMNQ